MKNVILKTFLGFLGIALLFTLFSPTKLFAAEDKALNEKVIEIFTSDECEFCVELEEELKKTYESSSYSLKNIDTSETNLKNFQIALVACGRDEGTVPMFLNGNVCVSGKDQIIEVFKSINSANQLATAVDADTTKIATIQSGLDLIAKEKPTDALNIWDYVIAGVLFVLLIVAAVLFIRSRKSTNKNLKMFSGIASLIVVGAFSGFLIIKVNDVNTLSSTGAEAGKTANNCLATNSCKDWNEFVNAKAENAKNEGRHEDAKEWEAKEVDQNILNNQINSEYAALVDTLKKNPTDFCGSGYTATTCTVTKYLDLKLTEAKSKAAATPACQSDPTSTDCKKQESNNYVNILYGYDVNTGLRGEENPLEGEFKDILNQYMDDKLKEAVDGFLKNNGGELNKSYRLTLEDACSAKQSVSSCRTLTDFALLQQFGFQKIPTDSFTGMGVYVLSQALRPTVATDECIVPTAGGACPAGTYGCECQSTPVKRAVCIVSGQDCRSVCLATHNVCDDCDTPTNEPPSEEPPGESTAVCQQLCSTTTPCSDGTSCVNGRCINESCPEDADCMCNTSTPICGDGIINNSPQAPEQCELGNPPGTSCDWNTCNQNSCSCPDTNPNWDIEKTSSVICINENTANASAQVKFNISATYINEDDPTEVGVLERVVDRPQNYLAAWLDTSSISNGGTYTTDGDLVDEIRWDLTGELSQFTIPSGQTEVTKTNFLSYTFNLPKAYFGRYVNLVTGYPNQSNDDNAFSYTHSVYIGCNVPSTSTELTPENLAKIFVGVFIVLVGLMFAISQAGNNVIEGVVNSSAYAKVQLLFTPKAKREDVSKEQFERKVLSKK